jgi:hypothetical protein
VLRAEVTREREVAAIVEAARVAMVLAVETSAQEAAMTRASTTTWVKDAEDRAALTDSLVWKITLHEGEHVEVRQVH